MTPDILGDALIRAFADEGFEARLPSPGTISVTVPGAADVTADIGEWRAHAGRNSRADLPAIAADFAAGLLRGLRREPADDALRRFEEFDIERMMASDSLRVRLYSEESLADPPGLRDALLARPLAPGLVQVVVADHPDSIMPVNRVQIGGTPEDVVFAAALRASLEKEPHYVKTGDVWDVPITHVGETHRYVGAHVHVLRRYLGPAPYGALVSFPIPEYVIVHEIGGTHLFAALEAMQALARTHVEQGERSISPQVYWWRPGAYEGMPEQEALGSGLVPDLRPVGVKVDHEEKSVAATTAETDELIGLWMRDHA
ncbi:hypothetical protein ACFY4C_08420 [Actinomadura viridis]|uniref:hypothetical protein n=1 Tax=Actinomadura viridis TaxID=58110 RepID=UPI0036ABAF09